MARKPAAEKKVKKDTPPSHLSPPVQTVDPHKFNGLKSMYLMLENFKNITTKVVDIGGRSLMIIGKNEAGKSSLIHALKGSMLSKYKPVEGLQQGQEHGYISHKIAGNINTPNGPEYHEYIIDIYFDEKTKEGRLKLTNEKGEDVKAPAEKLKQIIGNVSFDVNGWLNQPPREKLKMLKDLTGRGQEIDLLNIDIKAKEVQRTAKITRAEELDGILKNHGMTEEEIARYSTPIPIEPIQAEMEAIATLQQQFDNVRNQATDFYKAVSSAQEKIKSNDEEALRIQAEITRLNNVLIAINKDNDVQRENINASEKNAVAAEEWMRLYPRKELGEVSNRMTEATKHNQQNARIGVLAEQFKERIRLVQEAETIKAEVETLKANRNNIIANSQLGVDGLSFTEDGIFLNNLPFDDLQINTATRWKVGVQIAKALNPNYRGIFIEDGSLFDAEHLTALVHEIEKDGYFAIIEMVNFSGGELEVKFAEELLFGKTDI
jgi:AAA15 family ATPase/GTPase